MSNPFYHFDSLSYIYRISTKNTLNPFVLLLCNTILGGTTLLWILSLWYFIVQKWVRTLLSKSNSHVCFNSNIQKTPTIEQLGSHIRCFQDRQMTNRKTTHKKEIKLLWVCKLLYMPHREQLQYKKVVMHLVTKLLDLVQKLNYTVYVTGTLVHC